VRSSYFFARKEGWRRPRSRFVSCLPKAFWTSGGLAIRLAANGSVSTARMGFHGLHCGAGRFEWSEDQPRPHRRVRLLKLPCQTHWLVDEDLLAKHDAVTAHRRLDQIANLETDRIADLLGDGDLELRADLGCSACHGYESPTCLTEGDRNRSVNVLLAARAQSDTAKPSPLERSAGTPHAPGVRWPLVTASRIPTDVEAVVSVRAGEVPAREVGAEPDGIELVWEAVKRLYRSGIHPAIALCVRRRGHVVLDRAIGHSAGNGPADPPDAAKVLATPDTPFCIFSAAKAVAAMVVHLLDQRHLIHLDDPVCESLPEFAIPTKQWITIRDVLIHRAGIPNLPLEVIDLALLDQPDDIVQILAQLPQTWRPGRRLAYHAVTGGFILGEVVR